MNEASNFVFSREISYFCLIKIINVQCLTNFFISNNFPYSKIDAQ